VLVELLVSLLGAAGTSTSSSYSNQPSAAAAVTVNDIGVIATYRKQVSNMFVGVGVDHCYAGHVPYLLLLLLLLVLPKRLQLVFRQIGGCMSGSCMVLVLLNCSAEVEMILHAAPCWVLVTRV